MVRKVISIEAGVWWTKVSLVEYRKKNPPEYIRHLPSGLRRMPWRMVTSVTRIVLPMP